MTQLLAAFRQKRDYHLAILVDFLKETYVAILHPNRAPWKETTASLQHYPTNSLGRRLYDFLRTRNLQLQPKYESHDIYHILSGYDIGMSNEARMFFFLFGNGKKSVSVISTMVIALVFYPELWSAFHTDYKKGKSYNSFTMIDYQYLLHEDFDALKESLKCA